MARKPQLNRQIPEAETSTLEAFVRVVTLTSQDCTDK